MRPKKIVSLPSAAYFPYWSIRLIQIFGFYFSLQYKDLAAQTLVWTMADAKKPTMILGARAEKVFVEKSVKVKYFSRK